jgi:hypothetical protein
MHMASACLHASRDAPLAAPLLLHHSLNKQSNLCHMQVASLTQCLLVHFPHTLFPGCRCCLSFWSTWATATGCTALHCAAWQHCMRLAATMSRCAPKGGVIWASLLYHLWECASSSCVPHLRLLHVRTLLLGCVSFAACAAAAAASCACGW